MSPVIKYLATSSTTLFLHLYHESLLKSLEHRKYEQISEVERMYTDG